MTWGTVSPGVNQTAIARRLNPQNSFERTAGVVPTIYVPRFKLNAERYGLVADGVTDNAAAIARMRSVIVAKGGGIVEWGAVGTYKTSATLDMPTNTVFEGESKLLTVLQYTGVGVFLTLNGRNELRTLNIQCVGKVGTAVQIGVTDFAGDVLLYRCFVRAAATGVRLAAGLWVTLEECVIDTSTVGVDFNALDAAHYSTTVRILGCNITQCDSHGLGASNVPVRNQTVEIRGGSIEDNCATNKALYQCTVTDVENLLIDGVYFEDTAVGTKANALDLTGATEFAVRDCYFNGGSTGINGTATDNGEVKDCRFVGMSVNDVFLSAGANVHDIELDRNTYSKAQVIAGPNVIDYTGFSKVISYNENTAWVPVLNCGGTAATMTTQAASYTRQGKTVTFHARVTSSAINGAGGVTIDGLPVARSTVPGCDALFTCSINGATVSGGNTYFYAALASQSKSIFIRQGGSAANDSQLVNTQLAAATTIEVSGSYETD